jgi:hypothetical protein
MLTTLHIFRTISRLSKEFPVRDPSINFLKLSGQKSKIPTKGV